MPTSSTVWWMSTSRSPSASIVRSKPPCLPELLEHVVEERDAGGRATRRRRRRPRASSVDRGLLGRRGAACDDRGSSGRHLSAATSRSAARNASFSSGVPTVTRRQSVEPRPAREVAHEHAAVDEPLPERVPVAVRHRNSRKLAPDGNTVRPSSSSPAPRTAGRAPRRACATRAVHLVAESSASRARDLRGARRGGTAARPSRAPRPPTAGATAKPSRSAASDHTFE